MSTATLHITGLSPELRRRLDERARRAGSDAEDYVRTLIARDLQVPSLEDLLEPLRFEVTASGITESELTRLIEEARDEAWAESHPSSGS